MTDDDGAQGAGAPTTRTRDRGILERLAFDTLEERRRARRWGIFFKLLWAGIIITVLVLSRIDEVQPTSGAHTALVQVDGIIGAGAVDADQVIRGLKRAFDADGSRGIILRINSPGGSAVQAGVINDELRRLREDNPDKPVYAVLSDVCASGGYYVAVAAEKIYADKASIVGSIGVISQSFGFVEALDKLGIESRLLTAGEHKAMLDPFAPQDAEAQAHLQGMLDRIHQQFIAVVERGRGDRLSDNPELFSGLVWTGDEAVDLGLVDGLASAGEVAREMFGAERIVDYTVHDGLLATLARQLGTAVAGALRLEMGERIALPR